jgi:outer membrane protein OmpA-like peptidoglycan-associated protein/tetratricopeptide (TPR) repeat protein
MNKSTVISLLILTVFFPVSGQKIMPSPDDLYAGAVEFIFSGDYSDALPNLLYLLDHGYNSPNINYKIGECYLNIPGQKTKSIPYLKDASQKLSRTYTGNSIQEENAPYKTLLYLGIAYRLNNDFDKALLQFTAYLNSIDDVDKENKRLAEHHIERCHYARELMASPAKFITDTLKGPINTTASNSNPLVTSDEKVLYYMDQLKFYDAVMHAVKADTGWQNPENLTPQIKSDGDHYVTGMSADGTQLFLTAYDPYRSGEIFTTRFENGRWSELKKLNNNINTIFNETHASLSPDGQFLYFTSDRKGGYGGLDIYRSSKNATGDWGKPVNLGPLINTPFNEESPFVSSDAKKLFFSSQGHYNMGGYDVFYSSLGDDGNWLPPVNIGYPLNTTDDDLFFFPLGAGNIGYQSRFSASNAQMDIVRYAINAFGNPARFMVNGDMQLKADPGYDPSNISVAFIDINADDTLAVKHLNEDGSFRQKLPGGNYKLDFKDGTQSLLIKDIDIPDYFPHNTIVLHEEITVPSRIISDTLLLKDIRFAFNKSNLDSSCESYLVDMVNVLMKYPTLTLKVNGYADALGSDIYNLKLSLMRANSVADYLKNKTGLSERITVNGYGELNPVAVNKNINGTDNPNGRGFNRRVELVFINAPHELVVIKVNDIPEALRQK